MPDSLLEQLDIGQWAWEFLRRNPEYQTDYREFMALWQALDAQPAGLPDEARWMTEQGYREMLRLLQSPLAP